jgi:hypothetical protein
MSLRTTLLTIAIAAVAVPAAAAAPKPPAAGTPTLKAAPTIVVFGGATTLSGKVPGAKSGDVVKLQRDPFPLGDGYLDFRQATLGKNGTFSFSVPPFVATTYRVVAGSAGSTPVTVKVRPLVGLTTARSGSTVRFTGSVKPARNGARVSIQRKTASGSWTTVKHATLKAAGSARSTYAASLTVRSAGTYRARIGAAPGYLSGTSRERAVG